MNAFRASLILLSFVFSSFSFSQANAILDAEELRMLLDDTVPKRSVLTKRPVGNRDGDCALSMRVKIMNSNITCVISSLYLYKMDNCDEFSNLSSNKEITIARYDCGPYSICERKSIHLTENELRALLLKRKGLTEIDYQVSRPVCSID